VTLHDKPERATGGLVLPGEGRQLRAGPTRPTVKVGPHSGSQLLGLLESEVPPGAGFPGHAHDEYEEAFYVLDGPIEYLLDDTWITATTGSTVFVPAGRVHGFRNSGDVPCRHLAIASPAAAMSMIEELFENEPNNMAPVLAKYRSHLAEPK
jgi:quercetin dioxygenase-like cupin family protein